MPRFRWRSAVAPLIAGVLVLTGCSGGTDAVDQNAGGDYRYVGSTTKGQTIPVADRKTAGDATAPYLNASGSWKLSDDRGSVVVLNYWATYCGPCVTETPTFDKIYRTVKDKGVTFVGINVKEVSKSKAMAFITDNDISYPIVYDQTAKTALQLGKVPMSGLPDTVLIDKQGRVAAIYVGPVQAGDLQPVLDQLAAE